jgi:hypothetical protein
VFVVTAALVVWSVAPLAYAQHPTNNTIAVDADPSKDGVQSSASVAVGSTFTFAVVITDAPEPYGAYQANVRFDPDVVKYASGPVNHTLGTETLCGQNVDTDRLYEGCARQDGTQTNTGAVFEWTMTCVADGTSSLHLLSDAEVGTAVGTNFAINVTDNNGVGDAVLHDASVTCGSGGPEKTLVATPEPETPFTPPPGAQSTAISAAETAGALGTPQPGLTALAQQNDDVKTAVVEAKTPGSPANQTVTARITAGSGSPRAGGTNTGPNATTTAQALGRDSDGSGGGSNTGLIAGIIAAVVVVAAAAGGGALYLRRRRGAGL